MKGAGGRGGGGSGGRPGSYLGHGAEHGVTHTAQLLMLPQCSALQLHCAAILQGAARRGAGLGLRGHRGLNARMRCGNGASSPRWDQRVPPPRRYQRVTAAPPHHRIPRWDRRLLASQPGSAASRFPTAITASSFSSCHRCFPTSRLGSPQRPAPRVPHPHRDGPGSNASKRLRASAPCGRPLPPAGGRGGPRSYRQRHAGEVQVGGGAQRQARVVRVLLSVLQRRLHAHLPAAAPHHAGSAAEGKRRLRDGMRGHRGDGDTAGTPR